MFAENTIHFDRFKIFYLFRTYQLLIKYDILLDTTGA